MQKGYLSRTTKVPDHIRKALTGTIRIYNKDIIAGHNEDEKKDDVKLVVDDDNITKEEDKGFDDNDDQDDDDDDWGDDFDVQVKEEKAEENGTIQTLVISNKRKSRQSTIVKGRIADNFDDDDWGADFDDENGSTVVATKQEDITVVVKKKDDTIDFDDVDEDDDDDWGGDFGGRQVESKKNNNNNNVDLFARMHSALEQNEEIHLETPSFHKDGVDLFDGLDFREDPERDIIAKQSQEIVHLLEKMTSAKEVQESYRCM